MVYSFFIKKAFQSYLLYVITHFYLSLDTGERTAP